MPYLYSQAMDSIEKGIPLSLRAMCLEFPEDPTSWYLDRQFMLGDSLLVAPIFEESGDVEFYLPKGKWTNFFTGEVKAGPGWQQEKHDFSSLPLYVKENTVLVLGKEGETRTVYDYTSDIEVRTYFAEKGTKVKVVDSEGSQAGVLETDGEDGIKSVGQESSKGKWEVTLVS